MPARDDEEHERRRAQILDGALKVFASKGFDRATNSDVARAAGIKSPGLIYHYFPGGKTELLEQVLDRDVPMLEVIRGGESLMDLPPRVVLTRLATSFVAMLENRAALAALKLMFGEAMRRPAVAAMLNRLGPQRGLAFLSRYLAHQMERGTLRRMDPGVAVRCFIGPIIAYLLTRELFVQPDAATLAPATMVESAVEVFLRGMAPDGGV
jgi:AcrR family transcriptional regulator